MLALALALFSRGNAQSDLVPYVTFEGTAGGGTVRLTLTDDLAGIARAELADVTFTPALTDGCGTNASRVEAFDPPLPVDSDFTAHILFVSDASVLNAAFFSGALVSETRIEATIRYTEYPGVAPECFSDYLSVVLEAPADVPPAADDRLFTGGITDGPGAVTAAVTADGGLSYFALSGVPFSCLPKGELLDTVAFFEPPEVPRETTGQFQFILTVSMSTTSWVQVNVSARLVSDDRLEGQLHLTTLPTVVVCDDELLLSWTAQAIPATPTPAATASPTPPSPSATPASTAGPAALPPAGSGGGSGNAALPLLLSVGGLAVFAAGLRKLLR
jgi:hypothetical protein